MTYEECLRGAAEKNPNLIVMTAENRAAIRGLPEVLGPRFIDVGICEQTMIGAAAGLALRGRIPVAHALATFLTLRAFEFIRTDIGIPGLPVKLVGGVPGFLSEANGPTHQAIEDISLMRGIPNMTVVCPADADELVEMMPVILADPHPTYVRYNADKPVVLHRGAFVRGQAEVVFEGNDVTIVTYGFLLREAVRARETLLESGVSVRLVNMRSLKPVDERVLVRSAQKSRLVVTLEDHLRIGGLATILAEVLLKFQLTCRTLPMALEERWFRPGLLADVLRHEGFTGDQIAARILRSL